VRQGIRPDKVTTDAFNFKKPDLDLASEAEGPDDPGLEIYEYPGLYDVPADGSGLMNMGLERWQSGRKQAWGQGRCVRQTAGQLFTLGQHPRDDFNREFMLTRIEHFGSQPLMGEVTDGASMGYENRFLCMPSDVPYRPPQRSPKPTVNGVQTAVVVGPSGEEIHTDEHGRVKVQFHWDREGKNDDKSSCWIRVAQAWAGTSWGAMFIPRIGNEVVVTFLEGDPDRPLIVGSVYHGTNVPPYGLPDNKTKSTIKTNSSAGGEGSNELCFEDKKGEEEIFLHGQKDWNTVIENDATQEVKNDELLKVGNNRMKEVVKDQGEKVGGNKAIAVDGNHDEQIKGNETQKVGGNAKRTVDGDQKVAIKKNSAESVGGDRTESVDGAMKLTVSKDYKHDVTGNSTLAVNKNLTSTVKGDASSTVDGEASWAINKNMSVDVAKNHSRQVGEKDTITAGKQFRVEVGEGSITVKDDGTVTIAGKNITINGSGKLNVKTGGKLSMKVDGPVALEASGAVKVKGSNVAMN